MDIIIGIDPEDLEFPEGVMTKEEALALLRETAARMGEMYDAEEAEVSLTLTTNERIHELNKKWRGIDRPTDVLSFAFHESEEPQELSGKDILGDIVISLEKAKEQAAEYGHSLRRELAFLTVHGMLNLFGYDHMEEADRLEMEEEQRAVMDALNIPRENTATRRMSRITLQIDETISKTRGVREFPSPVRVLFAMLYIY